MNKFIKCISFLTRDTRKLVYSLLEEVNIGETQISILTYIDEFPGISQEKVRNFKNVDKAMIAKGVKKLIKNNYIYREKNKKDSRAYCLYLTERGKEIIPTVRKIIKSVEEIAMKDISKNELDIFFKVALKMDQNILDILDE